MKNWLSCRHSSGKRRRLNAKIHLFTQRLINSISSSICTTKPTKQWQKQARTQAAGSLLTAKAFVKSPVGLRSCGLSVMMKAEETPGCINRWAELVILWNRPVVNDREKRLLSGPRDCHSTVHQYWNSITGCSISWNTDCNEPRPVVGIAAVHHLGYLTCP